ncbi:STY0301 family protein [Citrobacter amalonaticus]|uniref:STY0301 family protein n=1 Tax=Citrobacter amalonaticus TaxID=35703 RepID=UPI00300C7D4E
MLLNNRFLSLFLLLMGGASAHAEEITCPDHVQMEKKPAISPVEGWHTSSRFDSLLNDGGFVSSGPPEERADLKGEDIVVHGVKGVSWEFGEIDNQHGIWFSCAYGQWLVILSKKVEGKVSTCWSPNGLPVKLICK